MSKSSNGLLLGLLAAAGLYFLSRKPETKAMDTKKEEPTKPTPNTDPLSAGLTGAANAIGGIFRKTTGTPTPTGSDIANAASKVSYIPTSDLKTPFVYARTQGDVATEREDMGATFAGDTPIDTDTGSIAGDYPTSHGEIGDYVPQDVGLDAERMPAFDNPSESQLESDAFVQDADMGSIEEE